MIVHKSKEFPTEYVFENECRNYEYYYEKRQKGENPKPINPHPLVKKYVHQCIAASQREETPPQFEFIEMTQDQFKAREKKEKQSEMRIEQESRREAREEEEKEALKGQRDKDLRKAATDPIFKEDFIWKEMVKAGYTVEVYIRQMAAERYDGKMKREFMDKRHLVLESIEKEIKQHS